MRHSSCSEVGSAVSTFGDDNTLTKGVSNNNNNNISPPLPPHALFAPDTRFSATSHNTTNTGTGSKGSVKSAEMMSREASEAVFSRVESLAILSGRYYNPSAKTNGSGKNSSNPSSKLFNQKGYVVYEVYVKANYTDYGWTCHRRGKPTAFVSEVETENDRNNEENDERGESRQTRVVRKNTKNTYPPRPKLPGKVYMGNFSKDFIEQRRIDLAKYLRYLYLNPYTRSCAPFLSFIAAERIIDHFQSFTPGGGSKFEHFTPTNSGKAGKQGASKVDFFHTPEQGEGKGGRGHGNEPNPNNTLTSFPYAFRSTRGGLDSYVGWDSERKKRKKGGDGGSGGGGGCAIL
ncbi:hypothetical protein TL16_g05752 [Triparma laevis f. inornata]|uniref:PX domain-containing protein n=1 Tax=Triparma laevis f. inornata TaxID=1714386 RepID=A0A9W7AM04_9STRA|nr:hypothetical protein TL16_g05752 [Triparma laevis f. inornata]